MNESSTSNSTRRILAWKLWTALITLLFVQGLTCQAISLNEFNQILPDGTTEVTVQQQSDSSLILTYNIAGYQLAPVGIQGDKWYQLTLAGEPQLIEKGYPDLPVIAHSIMIPDQGRLSARVIDYDYTDLPMTPSAPSKGSLPRTVNPEDIPFEFGSVYQQNTWPMRICSAATPYILRDYRGTTIRVTPAQYFPQTQTLRVFTRVVVAVNVVGTDGLNSLTRSSAPRQVDKAFETIYSSQFINFNSAKRYTLPAEQGSMLIVAANSLLSTVEPLADWRRQMGIPTTLVPLSEVGATANNIKSYVQAQYDTNNLAFLLLVGDAGDVPTFTASTGSSDPSYSKLAGADDYPDIFVGRFSSSSASDISIMTTRTIRYEKNPEVSGNWYHKAIGIASDEGSGPSDIEHMNAIRTTLLANQYNIVEQVYDPGASVAQLNTPLLAGRGFINYVGHGDITEWVTTGYDNSDINGLENTNKWPFIFDVACVNGQFDGYTCFAEAWTRASHNGDPSGALAIYASTINQDWEPPMTAQNEFNRLLTEENLSTFGALCFNASMKMMDDWSTSGVNMFNTWTIFGDPSVQVRTLTPHNLSVSCASSVTSTAFPVTVSGEVGALVALSQNNVLLGSAYTDSGGNATVYLDSVPGSDVLLTVTALNGIPKIITLSANASELSVSPGEFTVSLPANSQTTRNLSISNSGTAGSTLTYSLSVEADPSTRGPQSRCTCDRNISGSTVNISPSIYYPGSNMTFAITVTNESAGASVSWVASDPWSDALSEGASGTITVTISAEASGTVYIPWTMTGDEFGSAPHSTTGIIALTIAGPPPASLTLTSPVGGEFWAIGTTQAITWTSQNLSQNVNLTFSINGGTTWSSIVNGISDSGNYEWPINAAESTNCVVRIQSADTTVSDRSADAFTLYHPADWLTANQYSNSLSDGNSDTILLTFNANGKTPGTYQALLRITSNAGTTNIPVTMYVTTDAGTNFIIMISCGANGSISPMGSISVSNGCSTNFIINAASEFYIASLTTNGTSVAGCAGLLIYTAVWENVWSTGMVYAAFASISNETAAHGTPIPWLRDDYTEETDLTALADKANEDTDSDGLTGWQECIAGTDPTSASSVLQVNEVTANPLTGRIITWPSVSGRTYEIDFSTNLPQGFSVLQTGILSTGTGPQSYTDTLHQADTEIFYRIQVE